MYKINNIIIIMQIDKEGIEKQIQHKVEIKETEQQRDAAFG